VAEIFDAHGNLLHPTRMPREIRTAVSSIKVVKRNLVSGDGKQDEVYEVKFWDKVRALETLAKHFGLLIDKVEHTGSVDLVHRLQQARLRGKPLALPEGGTE
jgi:phage terminase small subunit